MRDLTNEASFAGFLDHPLRGAVGDPRRWRLRSPGGATLTRRCSTGDNSEPALSVLPHLHWKSVPYLGQFSRLRRHRACYCNATVSTTNRVIIVEDDPNTLSGYVEFLTAAGFEPTGAPNGADALPMALRNPPAAVVTVLSAR